MHFFERKKNDLMQKANSELRRHTVKMYSSAFIALTRLYTADDAL